MKFTSIATIASLAIASHTASAQTAGQPSPGTNFDYLQNLSIGLNGNNPYTVFTDNRNTDLSRLYQSGLIHLKAERFGYAASLFAKVADNTMSPAKASYMAGAAYFLDNHKDKAGFYLRRSLREHSIGGLASNDRKMAREMLREIRAE